MMVLFIIYLAGSPPGSLEASFNFIEVATYGMADFTIKKNCRVLVVSGSFSFKKLEFTCSYSPEIQLPVFIKNFLCQVSA